MTSRRGFVAGLVATGLCPRASWADAGAPDYLAAARHPDGRYVLAGLSHKGDILFQLPLPGRGHAATAHPTRPEAVAFARRPGTFAMVIDCSQGREVARLNAPVGRHFYGHGAFSADGTLLFTTENDFANGAGVIGVWDATRGYRRLAEFSSGGVGPHEMRLMPDGQSLVVANGGIETHPESGRAKLNIPVMAPCLSYLSLAGDLLEQVELPHALHKNSIRHLAVAADGTVGFAMQWQGRKDRHPPLLGVHQRGENPRLMAADDAAHRRMDGYAGSVAISGDNTQVAITSPRGGVVHVFELRSGALLNVIEMADVCGLGPGASGFAISAGTGEFGAIRGGALRGVRPHALQWDNHLIAL